MAIGPARGRLGLGLALGGGGHRQRAGHSYEEDPGIHTFSLPYGAISVNRCPFDGERNRVLEVFEAYRAFRRARRTAAAS